jgi:molybdopterin-guanine dinucleotide biosynthesis protein B
MNGGAPVIGICGWSGSGKTTLIEAVVRRLTTDGIRVAVVKHDAHGANIDRPGKDSDRFFSAGADVVLRDPDQIVFRSHRAATELDHVLERLRPGYDLVLVEGHKTHPMPVKVWLMRTPDDLPPAEVLPVHHLFKPDDDRMTLLLALLRKF